MGADAAGGDILHGDIIHGVPCVTDPDTAGFFEAAKRGELAVKACAGCGLVLHLPKAYCHRCGAWDTVWRTIPPTGTVYTWTTTERALRDGFPPPYTVVLIDLDGAPGARLVGHLPGRPELTVGMAMRAEFVALNDEVTIPQWHVA